MTFREVADLDLESLDAVSGGIAVHTINPNNLRQLFPNASIGDPNALPFPNLLAPTPATMAATTPNVLGIPLPSAVSPTQGIPVALVQQLLAMARGTPTAAAPAPAMPNIGSLLSMFTQGLRAPTGAAPATGNTGGFFGSPTGATGGDPFSTQGTVPAGATGNTFAGGTGGYDPISGSPYPDEGTRGLAADYTNRAAPQTNTPFYGYENEGAPGAATNTYLQNPTPSGTFTGYANEASGAATNPYLQAPTSGADFNGYDGEATPAPTDYTAEAY